MYDEPCLYEGLTTQMRLERDLFQEKAEPKRGGATIRLYTLQKTAEFALIGFRNSPIRGRAQGLKLRHYNSKFRLSKVVRTERHENELRDLDLSGVVESKGSNLKL